MIKAAKYEIQKPSTCRATLFSCKFCSIFAAFHIAWSTWPATKHLLRVEEMRRTDWLICKGTSKFVARRVVSLMKNEQQSQNLLLKVDPRSSFRNNFLQPATNVFVARQVDHKRWKTGNIDQNLQRNNVERQVEGFCISYFAALKCKRVFKLLYRSYSQRYPYQAIFRSLSISEIPVGLGKISPDMPILLTWMP